MKYQMPLEILFLLSASNLASCGIINVHPVSCHEGPEEEYRYSCALSLTSVLGGGWVVNATPPAALPWDRDPVQIVQVGGWAPGPVWTGAENRSPTGFGFPDRPACRPVEVSASCNFGTGRCSS